VVPADLEAAAHGLKEEGRMRTGSLAIGKWRDNGLCRDLVVEAGEEKLERKS
jgi:hypothetical protein